MSIQSIPKFPQLYFNKNAQNRLDVMISQIGKNVKMPDETRNYTIFNQNLCNEIAGQKEIALPKVLDFLSKTTDEKAIAEGVYIIDRMIDGGLKKTEPIYPVLSRFNNTTSPTVQALLAGIYRKTQVPDAFGPLCKMLIRNSLLPTCPYFDPNEEIGGAILDYIRNKGAVNLYQKV